jgi:hypothetical protein
VYVSLRLSICSSEAECNFEAEYSFEAEFNLEPVCGCDAGTTIALWPNVALGPIWPYVALKLRIALRSTKALRPSVALI